MINPAPILISTYNRTNHLMQCINSLRENRHASNSDLFIAIDYPSRDIDEKPNAEIVRFCKNIKGFKNIELIQHDTNLGARLNMKCAREYVFSKYERIICGEDDNVFAKSFLDYVNNGLNVYENRDDIFAICGYNYPINIPSSYPHDVYIHRNFCAWGFGLWKCKFYQLDFETKNFFKHYVNPINILKTLKIFPNVFCQLVADKLERNYFTGDSAICFHSMFNNKYSVHPVINMVRNTGHDGSGVHCVSDRLGTFLNQQYESQYNLSFPLEIREHNNINEILRNYADVPMRSKFKYVIFFYLLLAKKLIKEQSLI